MENSYKFKCETCRNLMVKAGKNNKRACICDLRWKLWNNKISQAAVENKFTGF